jgi:DNA topoisomerase 2-associated protein PAT1
MAFFGFQETDLEAEKQKFLHGGFKEEEDIAVYNWGQEDYDGLGNALQEGGDELNDETFGSTGPVGSSSRLLL